MKITFFAADCGDAALIKYKCIDGNNRNILIDSGYERTFDNILASEFHSLREKKEFIHLWLISHIHDDHIGGVVAYIKSLEGDNTKDIVNSWIYNFPREYVDMFGTNAEVTTALSIGQGDVLSNYIRTQDRHHSEVTNNENTFDIFGLRIEFLSPHPKQIQSLRAKYKRGIPLEPIEGFSVSLASGSGQNDYWTTIDSFNLNSFKEDVSIENGSSISMILSYGNLKIVWLTDSFPSTVIDKLNKMGYSKTNRLKCNLVKICHHGSKYNNSVALFELLDCANFVFSTNGENIHFLPHKACISMLLRNPSRNVNDKYHIYFTHDNNTLRSIFAVDGKDVFKKWNFEVHYSNTSGLQFDLQ